MNNATMLAPQHRPGPRHDRPDQDWVRGACPDCGEEVVANAYYVDGKGYIIVWECWRGLQQPGSCDFRRVL